MLVASRSLEGLAAHLVNKDFSVCGWVAPGCLLHAPWGRDRGRVLALRGAGLASVDAFEWHKVRSFQIFIGLFTCTLFTSMKALQHANLETVLCFRSCGPIIIALIECAAMGLPAPNRRGAAAMAVVLVSTVVYASLDASLTDSVVAYAWVLTYVTFDISGVMLGKKLAHADMTMWGRVMYSNALSAPPMLAHRDLRWRAPRAMAHVRRRRRPRPQGRPSPCDLVRARHCHFVLWLEHPTPPAILGLRDDLALEQAHYRRAQPTPLATPRHAHCDRLLVIAMLGCTAYTFTTFESAATSAGAAAQKEGSKEAAALVAALPKPPTRARMAAAGSAKRAGARTWSFGSAWCSSASVPSPSDTPPRLPPRLPPRFRARSSDERGAPAKPTIASSPLASSAAASRAHHRNAKQSLSTSHPTGHATVPGHPPPINPCGTSAHLQRTLVTGGTGLVGTAVRHVVEQGHRHAHASCKFLFVGSRDADLTSFNSTYSLFSRLRPTAVLHLAANVGGLYKNLRDPIGALEDNTLMGINVLRAAHLHGVRVVVSVLSTCVFPERTQLPMSEVDLHSGPAGGARGVRRREAWCRDALTTLLAAARARIHVRHTHQHLRHSRQL